MADSRKRHFAKTGNDRIDENFRRIAAQFNWLDITNELPTAGQDFYGHEFILHTASGGIPYICLKDAGLSNYTWTPYKGGVYTGPFGPLIWPTDPFLEVRDKLDDKDVANKTQAHFDTTYAECQKINLSSICPVASLDLVGVKWKHATATGDKFVICTYDANYTPYWLGPITPVNTNTFPPDVPDDQPTDDPDYGNPMLVIDPFEPDTCPIWNREAEGNIKGLTDKNHYLQGESSMRITKCVEIDDFDGDDNGDPEWTDDGGNTSLTISEDTDTKFEGESSLKMSIDLDYGDTSPTVRFCDGVYAWVGQANIDLGNVNVSKVYAYMLSFAGLASYTAEARIYKQSRELLNNERANYTLYPATLVATSSNTQTIFKGVVADLLDVEPQVYEFTPAFTPEPGELYTILVAVNRGGYVFPNELIITKLYAKDSGPNPMLVRTFDSDESYTTLRLTYKSNIINVNTAPAGDDSSIIISKTFSETKNLSDMIAERIKIRSTFDDINLTLETTDTTGGVQSKTWNILANDNFEEFTWDISGIKNVNKSKLESAKITIAFNTTPATGQAIWLDIWEACPGATPSDKPHRIHRRWSTAFDLSQYETLKLSVRGPANDTDGNPLILGRLGVQWSDGTAYYNLQNVDGTEWYLVPITITDDNRSHGDSVFQFEFVPPSGEDEFPESFNVEFMYALPQP